MTAESYSQSNDNEKLRRQLTQLWVSRTGSRCCERASGQMGAAGVLAGQVHWRTGECTGVRADARACGRPLTRDGRMGGKTDGRMHGRADVAGGRAGGRASGYVIRQTNEWIHQAVEPAEPPNRLRVSDSCLPQRATTAGRTTDDVDLPISATSVPPQTGALRRSRFGRCD